MFDFNKNSQEMDRGKVGLSLKTRYSVGNLVVAKTIQDQTFCRAETYQLLWWLDKTMICIVSFLDAVFAKEYLSRYWYWQWWWLFYGWCEFLVALVGLVLLSLLFYALFLVICILRVSTNSWY